MVTESEYKKLMTLIREYTLIGYNCLMYDCRLLTKFLEFCRHENGRVLTEKLYKTSCFIIESKHPLEIYHALPILERVKFIDLMPIAPDPARVSLKLYGARCHVDKLVNLPHDPHQPVEDEALRKTIREYCYLDIKVTRTLYEKVKERIDMRQVLSREYQLALMNKSDAQIAETIVRHQCGTWDAPDIPRTVTYTPPKWMRFDDPVLKQILTFISSNTFRCDENGKVLRPAEFRKIVTIGTRQYQMGVGGLHSCEKSQGVMKGVNEELIDIDVASYYPSIILNGSLSPRGLGHDFLNIYRTITTRRLEAKKAKQKELSEGLKIVINGSFGKFSSKYSVMFDPQAFALRHRHRSVGLTHAHRETDDVGQM